MNKWKYFFYAQKWEKTSVNNMMLNDEKKKCPDLVAYVCKYAGMLIELNIAILN